MDPASHCSEKLFRLLGLNGLDRLRQDKLSEGKKGQSWKPPARFRAGSRACESLITVTSSENIKPTSTDYLKQLSVLSENPGSTRAGSTVSVTEGASRLVDVWYQSQRLRRCIHTQKNTCMHTSQHLVLVSLPVSYIMSMYLSTYLYVCTLARASECVCVCVKVCVVHACALLWQ